MSGQLTLWGAGELLRSFFGGTAESPPEFYLALVRGIAPTPYVNGSELDEPDAPSYSRAIIANDLITWESPGALNMVGVVTQTDFIQAVEDWGTIRYWALGNALTNGDLYFVGELESPITVLAGDIVSIGTGELMIELGPFFASWES